jgi:hypothetical protein
MVSACRRDGLIMLTGGTMEGSRTGWVGLHRHDIVLEGAELVDFEHDGKKTKLTSGLGLKAVFKEIKKRKAHPGYPCYTVVYRRANARGLRSYPG